MGDGTPLRGDRAPTIGQYVVIALSDLLDNERVLTGTTNQIVVTDNGAGSTVVLSTPDGFVKNTVEKSSGYTATAADYAIMCDASGGGFIITLPAAASHTGRVYHIKKIDSSGNIVTVDGNSSETIDDATTAVLTTRYEAITIQCDGDEWFIL